MGVMVHGVSVSVVGGGCCGWAPLSLCAPGYAPLAGRETPFVLCASSVCVCVPGASGVGVCRAPPSVFLLPPLLLRHCVGGLGTCAPQEGV